MAKGKKTGGKNFEPGNRAAEGKALPAEIKAARKLRKADLEAIIHTLLYMTDEELDATLANPATPQIVKFVGKVVKLGVQNGDPLRLNHLAIWIMGRPDTPSDSDENHRPAVEIHRKDGTVVRMGLLKEQNK
jgi:hypothetical protein